MCFEWVIVITPDMLAALFVAFGIDLSTLENGAAINDASTLGRGYANAGGVGEAIIKTAEKNFGTLDIKFEKADTLTDCRNMLKRINNNESNPGLVEGMACPGGCVGGPGTLAPIKQAKNHVRRFSKSAREEFPTCNKDIDQE